ncbi:acyl carrier protein [Chitinophaga oryzae]|uniref:Acyl carrier protein n=1 Tax=Chitinophaga oryzae TaxID=2725414 RepID=A0AAE6ZCJ1_9BACT|nr:acyl carrier protein [Chitinophaga oryzae]QJB30456.1 acyl carrier protein [Chitinophaga oryzae]QJB36966.1 acyl carrier protein [Chitinophaga oryzae]
MENPITAEVINVISSSAGIPQESITADRSLDDLGLNSIMAVQLCSKLQQQFGVEAAPEEIFRMGTVGKIVDYVESRAK